MKKKKTPEMEEQRLQNTIDFINATQKLIDEVGLESISIRKIADCAGFHNSTIYLYFENLDELVMLASIKYFQEYSHELSLLSRSNQTPSEAFIKIWEIFLETVMERPNLFFNFFYGKKSDNLTGFMNRYYELFPEEKEMFSDSIESMYYGKNIRERSYHLLESIMKEENLVTPQNADMINDIIVSYCKYKLELKRQDQSLDSGVLCRECMQVITYLTGVSK